MSELAMRRSTEELQVAYLYWLSQMTQLSGRSTVKFREQFPTFKSWGSLSPADRKDAARNLLADDSLKLLTTNFDSLIDRALQDLEWHESRGIRILSLHGSFYPNLLKKIPDPPLVLFVKGALDALLENTNVAIIGTRDPTPTGERVAGKIAKWLGERNWCIVSGLAKGIDAAAHRGAIEAKTKTIAVMATPLDRVYPAENRELADEILRTGGCWVSELALGKKPHRGSFVQRDRIQSGLSVAVIPVQTDVEGGTMHTVRYAEEQKRLLLCPRPIDQESSLKQYAGIRRLIESHRATPFASEQYGEILETLSKHSQFLLGAGVSHIEKPAIASFESDHMSDRAETADASRQKNKKDNPKASGRFQSGFEFAAELSSGKAGKSKKRARKEVENEIEILEQLAFDIEEVKNQDGSRPANLDVFKSWLQSKIKALKQQS